MADIVERIDRRLYSTAPSGIDSDIADLLSDAQKTIISLRNKLLSLEYINPKPPPTLQVPRTKPFNVPDGKEFNGGY